jgi:hypothetical protein
VHLADRRLADNTGVNTALEIIGARGGLVGSAIAAGFSGVRKRAFIVVNAQVGPNHVDDESPHTPELLVPQTVRADPHWQRLLHEPQSPAPLSASTTKTHDD